jgi:zinc transporter ZupT
MVTGASAATLSHAHIAATTATTGVIAAAIGAWRLPGSRRGLAGLVVGVLAGAAVYLWRTSANMPQLNNDGLPGYSANDWLAPAIVFVVLSVYADLFPPADPRRFGQVRAAVPSSASP